MEGVLPLLGGEGLPGEDVVGDGQQGQRPLPQPLGRPVEASRLHLQRQDAELPVHGPGVGVVVVELVAPQGEIGLVLEILFGRKLVFGEHRQVAAADAQCDGSES